MLLEDYDKLRETLEHTQKKTYDAKRELEVVKTTNSRLTDDFLQLQLKSQEDKRSAEDRICAQNNEISKLRDLLAEMGRQQNETSLREVEALKEQVRDLHQKVEDERRNAELRVCEAHKSNVEAGQLRENFQKAIDEAANLKRQNQELQDSNLRLTERLNEHFHAKASAYQERTIQMLSKDRGIPEKLGDYSYRQDNFRQDHRTEKSVSEYKTQNSPPPISSSPPREVTQFTKHEPMRSSYSPMRQKQSPKAQMIGP